VPWPGPAEPDRGAEVSCTVWRLQVLGLSGALALMLGEALEDLLCRACFPGGDGAQSAWSPCHAADYFEPHDLSEWHSTYISYAL